MHKPSLATLSYLSSHCLRLFSTIWKNPLALCTADMDFFAYMEDAMIIPPGEESLVDDFAAFVLKMMRYDEGRRVIHLRKEMGFEMCGQRVDAETDVCVMERSGIGAKYLLLVQEDKVRKPYIFVSKICLPVA